ncbi:aminotransferase class I/II-fold pyridoxal phosphate-dependent enzyme [Chryseobacterium manosquense]|uniref:Aminotransferase class I/II-fold pyridoxal phosphate-dependent enzyme n=1 Tax=Chryseobacterium manosquense TaxID=2754694 RepID=A0A7H1DYU5_9FLAO|nr:methionine aminotransferase [Chryseobacterium manosquense]QNS42153.1 aminotransferase class I/II-fold pyridoxal phosphate-dependent enzyme [Chryseobacterium manosquense]
MIKRKHSGKDLTIFSEMTALAQRNNAVNLSQGFPDYEVDDRLKKLLAEGTEKNFNQYAPMSGLPVLVENLITFNQTRKIPISLFKENITISPGATYAIYTALAAIVNFGDEVIVLEPSYDSYVPAIEMNGGLPVFVSLKNDFEVDFDMLKNAISEKTKAIIINSPHNPSGKIWKKYDWDQLASIIDSTEIIVISDEVYDILTYDENEFYSAFHHPKLRERCFSIFSFGKMFHITGWKVGYILASEELTLAYRRVHQYLSFSVNSPSQYALAKYLEIFDAEENQKNMQQKRDFFLNEFKNLPFSLKEKAEAGYFQVLGYENISNISDKEFAIWLTEQAKVATIPLSAFYHEETNTGMIRFCFAKKEETIADAASKIKNFLG